jgi:nucleotide-binding universal stress UspA family protein
MASRVLVATDGSENAIRALSYVGRVLRNAPDCCITLLHVTKALPPELLEHGGSEDPQTERAKEEQIDRQIEEWKGSQRNSAAAILASGRETLQGEGVSDQRIEAELVEPAPHEAVAQRILEEAQAGGYDTIVVGRRGMSMMEKLLYGSVTEGLLRKAEGFTIWVVQ